PLLGWGRVGVRGCRLRRDLSIGLYPSAGSQERSDLSPLAGRGEGGHVSIFTYSKSPGLLSMPTLGGAIQGANWPISVTGVINDAMTSPSAVDGSHSFRRLFQVPSSIKTPSGVAWISLNSPIARWNATFGKVSLN